MPSEYSETGWRCPNCNENHWCACPKPIACPVHGSAVERLNTTGGKLCAEILPGGAYCERPLEGGR